MVKNLQGTKIALIMRPLTLFWSAASGCFQTQECVLCKFPFRNSGSVNPEI